MTLTSRLGTRRTRFGNFVFGLGGDFNADNFEENLEYSATSDFVINVLRQRFEIVNQTLSLIQLLIRIITLSASNALTLSETSETLKISTRSISNNLILNQVLAKTVQFNRSASNQLLFQAFFTKYLGNRVIHIPQVQSVKVTPVVLLKTLNAVIVLPTARLGDTQNNSGLKTEIKFGITGGIRTYIKKSESQKLKYSFTLDRRKSLELKEFLLSEGASIITLINWKGEVWVVNLTNSPFELISKSRGERVDVTLEFEGIKIGG